MSARIVRMIVGAVVCGVTLCGCQSQTDAVRYPVPVMLDPVTEVTPNVIE